MSQIIETLWDDDVGSSTVDWIIFGLGVTLLTAALLAALVPGAGHAAEAGQLCLSAAA